MFMFKSQRIYLSPTGKGSISSNGLTGATPTTAEIPGDVSIEPASYYASDPYAATGTNLHEQNLEPTPDGVSAPVYYADAQVAEATPISGGDTNPWKDTDLAAVDLSIDYRGLYNDAADAGASQDVLDRITELRNNKIQMLADSGQVATEWDGTIAQQITEPYMYNRPAAEAYKNGVVTNQLPKYFQDALTRSATNIGNPYTSGYSTKVYTAEMAKLAQDDKQNYMPQTWGLNSNTYIPVTSQAEINNSKYLQQYIAQGRSPYKPAKAPGTAGANQAEVDKYYSTQAVKLQRKEA